MNRLFVAGRMLLGLCFVCDGVWNAVTWPVRFQYLDLVGAPHAIVWLTTLLFVAGGVALILNYRPRITPVVLAATLLGISLILLTDWNGAGIGEYPADLQHEVLFKEWVVHLGIVAALALVWVHGESDATRTPGARGRRLTMIARAVVGAYFITNALWQWAYYDIRLEHIHAAGGSGSTLPFAIGGQLILGSMLALGLWVQWTALPLIFLVILSTAVVHGNIGPNAPYPPNAQIHQWFVKAALVAGLILVIATRNVSRSARVLQANTTLAGGK